MEIIQTCQKMKRVKLYLILLTAVLVSSCYENYLKSYDYDAIYTAYQYDLRTFVMGESQSFDFTVALGGVDNNDRDGNRPVVGGLYREIVTRLARTGDEHAYPFPKVSTTAPCFS